MASILSKVQKATNVYVHQNLGNHYIGANECNICRTNSAKYSFTLTMHLNNVARVMRYSKDIYLCDNCIKHLREE